MDPLVAEPERLGDLAHRRASGVQPSHRVMVVEPCPLGLVLQLEHPISRLQRLLKQIVLERHAV
jgi:hypothetical protein